MKARNTIFVLTALFSVLFAISMVSAASLSLELLNVPANVSHDAGTFTFTANVTNEGSVDANVSFGASTVSTGTATLATPETSIGNLTLAPASQLVTVTVTFDKFQTGSIAGTIVADDTGSGDPRSATFTVPILSSTGLSQSSIKAPTHGVNGSINVTNTGNSALSNLNISTTGNIPLQLLDGTSNLGSSFSLAAGAAKLITIVPDFASAIFGTHTVTVTANDSTAGLVSTTTYNIDKTFCSNGPQGGNLSLDININNKGDSSGDDEEWFILDQIEVEVKVDNDGNDKVKDVRVELGLFDTSGTNDINDLDFDNSDKEEIDLGDISDDKDDTATFIFDVPADFDDGSYKLAVKTFSDQEGESVICTDSSTDLNKDFFEEITVSREDDEGKFIAFNKIRFEPSESTCGDTVSMTLDVVNIGDEDQDQVKVSVVNKELDIDLFREIKTDLDQGDEDTISFSFQVPQDAKDKTYVLELDAEYDYRPRDDEYRDSLDDEEKIPFNVIGCSATSGSSTTQAASISAALDSNSEAKAGQPLTVKATISNLNSEATSFVIDAKNFESWGTLGSISDRVLTLQSGETKDVLITFNVNPEASGQQTFTVQTQAGSQLDSRSVAVNIAGSGLSVGGNNTLWVIGIINVVLIILIIVVAVRLSNR
ncbi:hypothetical protein CMI48_01800 [Candidatus Pacearchaeota archaeon]|nr:hypothetical protein [Candidatus Pacearchaeota archaeon]